MWQYKLLYVLVLCLVHTSPALAQWACVLDSDCSDVEGSVCHDGTCGCPTGQQIGLSGQACIPLAPYHTSACVEDHQCSRLFTSFECRWANHTDGSGACACQVGHHYFLGRCWPSSDFGEACSRDEQCITVPRDPYNLKCDGTCVCADGYYDRQRGECRKSGNAVGDRCVLDVDCQWESGVCEINTMRCVDSNAFRASNLVSPDLSATPVNVTATVTDAMSARSHGVACSFLSPCPEPLECSAFGACVCPVGYYLSDDSTQCNAELGSRSTPEQCVGLLAEVIDGICTCPANFFFEESMRDCVKVTRRMTDSCVSDENCHTFGSAARCGPPGTWGLRTCECDADLAVWEEDTHMCRLFVGIGEQCIEDRDCLAGEFEINCVDGMCACPEGLTAFEGLCLTTGLGLGDACQASVECNATTNSECAGGWCSCRDGYQREEDFCAPIIGGTCTADSDCVIEDTVCVSDTPPSDPARVMTSTTTDTHTRDDTHTCRCRDGFVAYNETCWKVSGGYADECTVTSQCTSALGPSVCRDGACACDAGHHLRDHYCWPVTDLFSACSRTSQCYLPSMSERTVCRNSICQCSFDYPFNEELHTCGPVSSGSAMFSSTSVIVLALTYLILS